MVNGANDLYVERKGRLERAEGLVFAGLVDSVGRNDAPHFGLVRVSRPPGETAHPPISGYASRVRTTLVPDLRWA
jgi:hypothetical protein